MTIHPCFVGIDVSKAALDIFDAASGQSLRIDNSDEPIAALAAQWKQNAAFILFEATGRYDRALRMALASAGVGFARVNPGRARDFARAAGFLAKTDKIDARMLAAMAKALRPDAEPPLDQDRERLRSLHRRRDQLVAMRQKERTRRREAVGDFERSGLERHIAWLGAEITALEQQIAALIASIDDLSRAAKRLRQVPGVGPVTALTLIALMPELGQRSPKAIAALAGLAPLNHDSGKKRGQRAIDGGRKRVRDALYMAAVAASQTKSRFADFYKALRAAGKPPKLAFIALARKLLVTLNAITRDNAEYAP